MANSKRIFKNPALIALVLLTTSCAAFGVVSDLMDARNSTMGCFESLKTNPKYTVLYKKMAIFGETPSEEQLADTEIPSPEMVQEGMNWFEEDQACNKAAIEIYTNMDRDFGAKVAGWVTEATDIFNDTMAKTPPYGYINARIKHLRERQKKDIQDWIRAETKRRQAQMQPVTTSFLNSALMFSLQVLTRQQLAIFQVQTAYMKRVPTYRPVNLTKLTCFFEGKKFVCREDPLKDGVRVEDVVKGVQQIQQQLRPTNPDQ